MDVSNSGLFIVTGSHDRTAKLWSLDRTFPIRVFVGHMSDVTVNIEMICYGLVFIHKRTYSCPIVNEFSTEL